MEKLYNNVILKDDFRNSPCDFTSPPHYLVSPPSVIDVSRGRQLFVDDFLIEETDLVPEYHTAKKMGDAPVFKAETPWETDRSPGACPKSGGVWFDEDDGIFKMWYEAGWLGHLCYAESKDGIHWERPSLDIVPDTNIILTWREGETDPLLNLRPDSTSVIIDYTCPKSEKYKLFLRNPGGKMGGIVAVSGDGIHFERFTLTTEVYDRSTVFYNPFRKKWVYSIRDVDFYDNGEVDRKRDYRECDDFIKGAVWQPDEGREWMRCDSLDIPNPYIRTRPQLYNVDCVGYESIMLGMFQIFYGPENYICEKRGIPKVTELIPMYSRDGYNFTRPSRESIIKSSIYKGAWDRGYVQSVGGVSVVNGDELWIYYIGFAGDESYAEGHSWFTNGCYRNGATGIATLRRDGFVSMNGRGRLLTRPITFNGKSSISVNAVGKVFVRILSSDGRELSRSNVFEGDSTSARLILEGASVESLNDETVRLEFDVDGKLYSFGFENENGDFGGAHAAGHVR